MRVGMMLAAAAALVFGASQASASITININQVGTSVVASGSGSFDLTGLGPTGPITGPADAFVRADEGLLRIGATALPSYRTGLVGPASLGSSDGISPTSSSGDQFGVGAFANLIYLPFNYVSGTALSGMSTFDNATLTSLGLTSGTFVYRSAFDTVTVNIGLPEITTWAMFTIGIGSMGYAMRRRHQRPALAINA